MFHWKCLNHKWIILQPSGWAAFSKDDSKRSQVFSIILIEEVRIRKICRTFFCQNSWESERTRFGRQLWEGLASKLWLTGIKGIIKGINCDHTWWLNWLNCNENMCLPFTGMFSRLLNLFTVTYVYKLALSTSLVKFQVKFCNKSQCVI